MGSDRLVVQRTPLGPVNTGGACEGRPGPAAVAIIRS